MKDNQSWMDTKEVCEHLCVSARTLERYRKRDSCANPFPDPDDYCIGRANKWRRARVLAWQQVEVQLPKRKAMQHIHGKFQRDQYGRITRHCAA